MNIQLKQQLVFAAMLGVGGISFAWYAATSSREAEVARNYLRTSPTIQAKYKSVDASVLTGFRIAGAKSYLTYWVRTPEGRKLVRVVVDKSAEPWTVAELPSEN